MFVCVRLRCVTLVCHSSVFACLSWSLLMRARACLPVRRASVFMRTLLVWLVAGAQQVAHCRWLRISRSERSSRAQRARLLPFNRQTARAHVAASLTATAASSSSSNVRFVVGADARRNAFSNRVDTATKRPQHDKRREISISTCCCNLCDARVLAR